MDSSHKPILIVIAGPNGSGKTTITELSGEVDRLYVYDNSIDGGEARPLFRLKNGEIGKIYTDQIPEWAKNILPTSNKDT